VRVDVSPLDASLMPGVSQLITVTISNTETVIAGYAIRVLGADPGWVQLEADDIALFPDESRTLTITVDAPKGIPAGSRRLAVQVRELTPPYASKVTEIDLSVPPVPVVQLRIDPLAITAGKRATFSLLVENTGNTDIKGILSGDDPENQVGFTFDPERVSLAPGQHGVIDMRASAKRHFLGTPTVRSLSVYLDEAPDDPFFNPPPAVPAATAEEREPLAGATFIQKSVMSRGALSLLGLLFAATVFAVVITIALSRLVAQSTADRNLALQVAAAKNNAPTTGKSGVTGTVDLLTSGKPVAGVAVSVFASADTSVAIATTATNTKGVYSVTDLPAGKYVISFRGAGFVQIWYPGAATASDATTITLAASQVQAGLNVSLGGVPATIAGSVVGDDVSAATLFLETVPKSGGTTAAAGSAPLGAAPTPPPVTPPDNGGAVVQRVPIGSDGSFSLANVPSPSVYDLVVVKTGYATSTQRIDIGAGENRTGVQLTLSKGDGLITGTITSGSGPLGGVTVTATSGQQTANTVSLTGTGAFTLRQLPTPDTFTLVASEHGFASQTVTLSLTAGQKLTGVAITLSKSSASLTGVVTLLPQNTPAPGVGVTVTDGELTVQTATESADNIGSWSVGGLAVPGTYTVTFARSDLQSQTVSVSLDATGHVTPGSLGARITSAGIAVSMESATATMSGTIKQPGSTTCKNTTALGEATVNLSSGSTSYSVTSASVAPNCGKYRIEQIPPGTYTMTVSSSSGTSPSSQVITLIAGESLVKNVSLPRPASLTGTVLCCTTDTPPGITPGPRIGWTVFIYQQAQYPTTVTATTTTNSSGKFTFDDLEAGTYIVAVGPTADPSNTTTTQQVNLQPSEARTGVKIMVDQ
jgi:Carboxypeptidase regulatory-like domain